MTTPTRLPQLPHDRGSSSRPLFKILAALSIAALSISCSKTPVDTTTTPSPTPTSRAITSGPRCKLRDEKPFPGWLPEVPLPKGSYFSQDLPVRGGFHRGVLLISMEAAAFKRFVGRTWERAGISLFRPDSEPGEVESFFRTSSGTGLFKANDVLCGTPHTRLLLVYRV
jgi:hypothetical protein